MIKITKIKCNKNIRFGKLGSCFKDRNYIARLSMDGDRFLILASKNEWVNITNPIYNIGFDGIYSIKYCKEYLECFTEIENFFVKNKKELFKLKFEDFN